MDFQKLIDIASYDNSRFEITIESHGATIRYFYEDDKYVSCFGKELTDEKLKGLTHDLNCF